MNNFKSGYIISLANNGQVYLLRSDGSYIGKVGTKGYAPENYYLPVGISTLSPDSIFVADYQSGKILLFNKEGNYVNSWNVIKNDPLNTFSIFYNYLNVYRDTSKRLVFEYLGRSDKYYYMTNPDYYKNARLLTVHLPDLNIYKHYIPYEEGSPYLGQQFFLSPLDPCINKLPNNFYAVVFAHEDCIYLYNRVGELVRKINGNSGYFPKAKGVSFSQADKQFGTDYVKYNIKQNALNYLTFHSFYTSDFNLVITKQYEAPVHDENLPDDLNTLKYMYFRRDSYLQFYSLEGNKLFDDIKQPYRLRHLVYAESFDRLIFKVDPKLTEKNILYVAKLVY
ncbi:MAG: hypothetical protein N2044_06470 [Cyclobacteriaceae bacterium]|nr:hypothetical protein [Cyclobacteriaceae bacterium]